MFLLVLQCICRFDRQFGTEVPLHQDAEITRRWHHGAWSWVHRQNGTAAWTAPLETCRLLYPRMHARGKQLCMVCLLHAAFICQSVCLSVMYTSRVYKKATLSQGNREMPL